jgi:hypothetical protein
MATNQVFLFCILVDLEFGISAFIHVDSGMISVVFLAVVVANTICILILGNVFYHYVL